MSAPSVPLIVKRPRATNGQLEFWWAPPTSGAPITGYTLACPALSISNSYGGSVGHALVSSVPNKTDVTFTLTATNANGTGPAATYRTVQCGDAPYSKSVAAVTASTVTSSSALVTWTPSSTATQAQTKWYAIRAIPSNFPVAPSSVQSGFGTDTQRYLYNLSANTTYQFLINSINDVMWAKPGMYTSSITMPTGILPPFVPTQIAGLQIWLDAIATSNFTFSSGSNISSWLDRSGNGQNTTNTAGNMVYSTINGTASVNSPTNVNQMQCGTSTFTTVPASSLTVVGMVNYTNGSAAALANIISIGAYGQLRIGSPGNGSNALSYNPNANDFSQTGFVNGTFSSSANYKYVTYNTPFQFVATNQSQAGSGNFYLTDLAYGRGWVGYYNEILLYQGSINPVARQVLEGYLAWKWNRVTDLPAGHPYKSAAPTNTSPLS